jgi:hypothetical protein
VSSSVSPPLFHIQQTEPKEGCERASADSFSFLAFASRLDPLLSLFGVTRYVDVGKAGKNVADLRELTGVKAGVSKVVQGVNDRVLSVSGNLDGVAHVSGFLAFHYSSHYHGLITPSFPLLCPSRPTPRSPASSSRPLSRPTPSLLPLPTPSPPSASSSPTTSWAL